MRHAVGMAKSPIRHEPFVRSPDDTQTMSEWDLRTKHRALFHGVYVLREAEVDDRLLAQAALLIASPGSYISHHSAARLWGGTVPDNADTHVTSPRVRLKSTGVAGHRRKDAQQVVVLRGIPMTSALQTFFDMSHLLSLVDLVVLGDSLVKAKRFTPERLVAHAASVRGPHSRLARRAAGLVRSGVDSPMETRLRLLIILAGLPEPAVDHRIHDRAGNLLYRFDLCYVGWGLIIEYDGVLHSLPEQWMIDIGRDEQLDIWKIRRLVIVSPDIYRTPANTLRRIVGAMAAAGMPVPVLQDEWRRHFFSRPGDIASPA